MGRVFRQLLQRASGNKLAMAILVHRIVALLLVFALLRFGDWLSFFKRMFLSRSFRSSSSLTIGTSLYWYFPMLGICGIVAMLTRSVTDWLAPKIPSDVSPIRVASVSRSCLCRFMRGPDAMLERRVWQAGIGREYRGFVESLQALPSPNPGETLYSSRSRSISTRALYCLLRSSLYKGPMWMRKL